MKFTCEKHILQAAVTTASRATSQKSPIPALEGLLIQAGVGIKVTGYDLKKGIYTTVEADVQRTGSAVFGAKLFVEMIRRLPDGRVSVEVQDNLQVSVKCGRSEYNFTALPASDYPELPELDKSEAVSLPQKQLRSMIEQTIFAVSTNESRPVYMGSMFEIEDGNLRLISVDGFRLAMRREKIEGCELNMRFIIPASALSDVQRICEDSDDIISINVGSKHASFTIGDTVIVSRRLEGDFLDHRKAVPREFKTTIGLKRDELLSVVDRVSLIVDEKVKNPVRIIFGDGQLNLICVTPQGKAEDFCSCEGDGGDVEIGFNDRYMRDALRVLPADELNMCINTGSAPCVLCPADGGDSFTYMILPVRLRAGE